MGRIFQLPRFMTPRQRKSSEPRYIWQPGPRGRKAGFKAVQLNDKDGLPSPLATAMAQSEWLNTVYDLIMSERKELAADVYNTWLEKTSNDSLAGECSNLPQCPPVTYQLPGVHSPAPPATDCQDFNALTESYRASSFFDNVSVRTRRDYNTHLKKINALIGDLPVTSLKRARLRRIYEALLTAHGPHVANARFRVLRLVLSWAVELEWIEANPALRFRMVPTGGRIHFITAAEHDLLVKTADTLPGRQGVADACELAYGTGQRRGDLVRVQEPQWTGKHLKLWIRKTGKYRSLKATGRLLSRIPDMLERRRQLFPDFAKHLRRRKTQKRSSWLEGIEDATLIINHDTGLPYMEDTLSDHFGEVRRAASKVLPTVELARFADYRDTAIIELRRAGADIPSVTGHSPSYLELIFKAYADQFDEEVSDQAIDRLDDYRAQRTRH